MHTYAYIQNFEQNNGNTNKLRIIICVGYIERTSVGNTEMFFFRLFTLCSARVVPLMLMMNDSPCERIGKWETWPILKEDKSLLRI
jgi:hypothetical protein